MILGFIIGVVATLVVIAGVAYYYLKDFRLYR